MSLELKLCSDIIETYLFQNNGLIHRSWEFGIAELAVSSSGHVAFFAVLIWTIHIRRRCEVTEDSQ